MPPDDVELCGKGHHAPARAGHLGSDVRNTAVVPICGRGAVGGTSDTMRVSSEIEALIPGVDPDGVYEIICASGTVYTVAWSTGWPTLVQRFPTYEALSMWLDDGPVEFDTLPTFRVGEPVELGNRRRGDGDEYSRSTPIVAIRKLEGK